jgi:hypothetical protein
MAEERLPQRPSSAFALREESVTIIDSPSRGY